ncbi:hypothetical protein C8J56DRAFT_1062775 [Mycena floridula]|nr:hypothetical protein C8J56DRAFT_1062775 [Mycena floridula]
MTGIAEMEFCALTGQLSYMTIEESHALNEDVPANWFSLPDSFPGPGWLYLLTGSEWEPDATIFRRSVLQMVLLAGWSVETLPRVIILFPEDIEFLDDPPICCWVKFTVAAYDEYNHALFIHPAWLEIHLNDEELIRYETNGSMVTKTMIRTMSMLQEMVQEGL